jgi:nitrogen fixation/metabolism regulation signal transduction histidine kinase
MAEIQQATLESTVSSTPVNERKWKNFFVKPGYQMNYLWHQAIGGVLIFGLAIFLVNLKLAEISVLMNQEQVSEQALFIQVDAQTQINWVYAEITTILMASFAIYVVYACLVMLLVSHRVSGPMVAIADIIDQFSNGNYSYQRPLRNNDELGAIHERLKRLSEHLVKKDP